MYASRPHSTHRMGQQRSDISDKFQQHRLVDETKEDHLLQRAKRLLDHKLFCVTQTLRKKQTLIWFEMQYKIIQWNAAEDQTDKTVNSKNKSACGHAYIYIYTHTHTHTYIHTHTHTHIYIYAFCFILKTKHLRKGQLTLAQPARQVTTTTENLGAVVSRSEHTNR